MYMCTSAHIHTHTPQFFYVTKGQLLFDINAQQFRLKPHMSIHIPSGTHHTKGIATSHTCTRHTHTHHSSLVPSLHCLLFFLHVGKKKTFFRQSCKKKLVEETGNEAKTIPHTHTTHTSNDPHCNLRPCALSPGSVYGIRNLQRTESEAFFYTHSVSISETSQASSSEAE